MYCLFSSMYCLSRGQTIHWRTDKTLEDRQYIEGQTIHRREQTIHWRTDNTLKMTDNKLKRKDKT
jgi:hypothetical protein